MPRLLVATLACLLVVAGCGGSSSAGPLATPPDLASLVVPSLEPPGASPSPSVDLPSVAPTSEAPLTSHPVARLAAGGADVVDGVIGSWTLDDMSAETPWKSATSLETVTMTPDDLVLVGWSDGTPIGTWAARIAPATDTDGSNAEPAGSGEAGGADFVTVGRVSPGDWVFEVTLTRADGRGEATYYWSLEVR